MISNKNRVVIAFFVVLIVGSAVFVVYKRPDLLQVFAKPCAQPILYSLGSIDPKFGLSQQAFQADINQATMVWDQAINKPLFAYSPTAIFKINLVYDYRQAATDQLKKLGLTIDDSQSSYQQIKREYDSEVAQYNVLKQKLNTEITSYNQQSQAYEQTVNYWNSRGGAPKATVDQINRQRDQLNAQAVQINQDRDTLNNLVDSINGLANTLNRLASALNLNVSTYNSVGSNLGQQFEEGVYISQAGKQEIDIYEFENQLNLVRVLAHEFGHSLGMEHVSDPNAIMYYLNQGKNITVTADDIKELDRVCKL